MSASVVVVGSVNRDYVCRVPTIPLAGQTLLGGELTLGSGGKGGNQAVAAARLGAPTTLVACVGADPDGKILTGDLSAAGVKTSDVRTLDDVRTGTAFVLVADDGENAIVVAPGANASVDEMMTRAAVTRLVQPGDLLVVQGETPAPGVDAAVEEAHRRGARVVLNLAPYRDIPDSVLAVCDPLVVNEGEARSLLRRSTSEDTDWRVLASELGARTRSAVVTLGAAGAMLVSGDEVQHVQAEPVAVVDTTGAGDAFIGALAAALCGGATLHDAVRLGVAVAGHAVGRAGAQASYPTLDQLPASWRSDPAVTGLRHQL